MQKVGIFIGRMNPPHLGHLNTIETSLKENDSTIVFLGSANISNNNNPYSFQNRELMLIKEFQNRIKIKPLEDIPSDKQWVINLGIKINEIVNKENIILNIYCGDITNDYAITVIKKYIDNIGIKNIKIIEISRNLLTINHEGDNILLSSTKVRQAIKEGNNKLVYKMISNNYYKLLHKDL